MYKQIIYVVATTLLLISCTNKPKTQENKTAHSIAEQFTVSIHDKAAQSLIGERQKTTQSRQSLLKQTGRYPTSQSMTCCCYQ